MRRDMAEFTLDLPFYRQDDGALRYNMLVCSLFRFVWPSAPTRILRKDCHALRAGNDGENGRFVGKRLLTMHALYMHNA